MTATPVRAGRPRSAEADDAILDAALDQFCDFGYDGLSVERVAAGAGVAKTTIYRRYPTKLDLVMAALARAKEGARAPVGSGSLRADLLDMARSYLAHAPEPVDRACHPDDAGVEGPQRRARRRARRVRRGPAARPATT